MLWSKQFYEYDVHHWLREHGVDPLGSRRQRARLRNATGSTCSPATSSRCPTSGSTRGSRRGTSPSTRAPLALVDVDFAKEQLELLLTTRYMHPNGQLPAYEWNFSDVNPPVHAWAALFVYRARGRDPRQGRPRLPGARLQKLLPNFTWWVNRKDADGRNLFQGGFLGLDNIGVFDRSAPLPGRRHARAGRRHRLDGAVLPEHAPDRARAGQRRPELPRHGAQVRRALRLDRRGHEPARRARTSLWDEEDGFFYDVLRLPTAAGSRSRCARWSG